MKVEAPAKLNLGLHVLRRRGDGYHDIETVMVRLRWFDTIAVQPAQEIAMTCSEPSLPVDADNLCMKAAHQLRSRFGIAWGAQLHLTKTIPVGAGLGGGSSDAAATLRLLADLWNLDISDEELSVLGAQIGSDVPFFLGPSPALASGRGEVLQVVTADDDAPLQIPFTFVVVKPERSVSTAEAYRWVQPSDRDRANLPELVRSCDLERWRRELTNDFEHVVAARISEIDRVKAILYEAGAGFAGMSGSGSAVFGLFDQEETANEARKIAEEMDYVCWMGRALDRDETPNANR